MLVTLHTEGVTVNSQTLALLSFLNILGFVSSCGKKLHQQANCFHLWTLLLTWNYPVDFCFCFLNKPNSQWSTATWGWAVRTDRTLVFTIDVIAFIFPVSHKRKTKTKRLPHNHAVNISVYRRLCVVFRSVSLSFQSMPMSVLPGVTKAF